MPYLPHLNLFISRFCEWSENHGLNSGRRSRLARDLKTAILDRLPKQDDKADVIVRPLTNSGSLNLHYQSPINWICSNGEEALVGVVAPHWARGWGDISKDYEIENLIANFFHFAAQYVARSRTVGFIGALTLTYNRECDYRSQWLSQITVAPDSIFSSVEDVETELLSQRGFTPSAKGRMLSPKQREFLMWVEAINALDPYVHRAVHQYWRANSLFGADFYEEGVTALDGLISVASQFANARLGFGGTGRNSLAAAYTLTPAEVKVLSHIYNLRCDFGAHPSRTKWWDFAELYDSDIDDFRETAKKLLIRMCRTEARERTVEPRPSRWSEWFLDNCIMLLDAVWFTQLR